MNDVCPNCGEVHPEMIRRDIGVKSTREEADGFKFTINKLNCARQAISMMVYPKNATQDDINKFVGAAIEYEASAQFLMQKWWEDMIQKYGLLNISGGREVMFDSQSEDFFILEPKA